MNRAPAAPTPAAARASLKARFFDTASLYLPLALMCALALGSWQLVRQAPQPANAPSVQLAADVPDFVLHDFSVSRFNAQGTLTAHLKGHEARHFNAGDALHVHALDSYWLSASGTATIARAERGISQNNGQIIDLQGNARIHITPAAALPPSAPLAQNRAGSTARGVRDGAGAGSDPVLVQSPTLRLWPEQEKLRTDEAVTITRADAHFSARGMDYEHAAAELRLHSRVRGVLLPSGMVSK